MMDFWQLFHGPNAGYVLELYDRYRQNPDLVDADARAFFSHWSPPNETVAPVLPIDKIVGAVNLAQAIREYGHTAAQLDPLGGAPPGDPALSPTAHGLTEADLRDLPASLVGGPIVSTASNAQEALQTLRTVYSSHIGFDYDHIRIPEEREWLREAAESRRFRPPADSEYLTALLERLTQVEVFEHFLQRTFPTKYRFSIEGLDMTVPILDEVVSSSARSGISNILIGMAHRGRLNVLAHIMNKPYEQILAEFKDPIKIQELQDAIGWTIGDVKYHQGLSRSINIEHHAPLIITMPPNPSHLEVINPISVGMARAAGTTVNRRGEPHFNPDWTLQILIHGDAAFPGQGIVAETFNLSQIPGYFTGGTLHIITNNQLGFTTDPHDSRSTLYASDLAKGFKVPIIHVNADDPEACIEVARIAYAYQDKFEKDFLIDLVGYRRYGHNELDEPGFTQPLMYQNIRDHRTVRQLWANELVRRKTISAEKPEEMVNRHLQNLQTINDTIADPEKLAEPKPSPPPPGEARRVKTSIPVKRLKALNESLSKFPDDFTFYSSRLEDTIRARRKAFDSLYYEPSIDWATAEELAFASILEDGIPIRLTGQDTERGTFSHRHAVLHDAKMGKIFVPLQELSQSAAAFEVHNSPLSEAAVLGFEYGYNVQAPERLVIWEAQYGDFINNAQIIIDEFIVSAREKWGQTPSLVMLLPHGWEGAGPDHSSARLERFLNLGAKINMRVANCTTAAQYFHLLRRQAILLKTDPLPLVIMTPKSLLRNPAVASSVKDLTESNWHPVIDDADAKPEAVQRMILCSGKFYLDLVTSEYRAKHPDVAVVRIEQLYPFPAADLQATLAMYPNLREIVWAQEEPKNMGAWEFISWRLERLVKRRFPVNYVGRRRSSSPAEGSSTAHKTNQAMIIEYAFNWKFDKEAAE